MVRAHHSAALRLGHKAALYGLVAALWLTGVVWLGMRYFSANAAFGPRAHPTQTLMLELHGAAAMGFLVVLGMLLTVHVPVGWKQRPHRPTGLALLLVSALLSATGWGLYYIGSDSLRNATSMIHWVMGLLLPAILIAHIALARRKKFG